MDGGYTPVYGAEGDAEPMSRRGWFTLVTPGSFEALGLELEEGRLLTATDPATSVVVSRALADEVWPGESPLGRGILTHPWGEEDTRFEVVGVVSDARFGSLRDSPSQVVYFPADSWAWAGWAFHVVVRGPENPRTLVPALRSAVADVGSAVPIADIATYEEVIARGLAAERFSLALVGVFAASALVLALLGLYGIIAYQAARRRREFGIRIAVGAGPGRIAGLILAETARFTLPGLVAGVLLMAIGSRYLTSQLYGVPATDLETYVVGIVGLGGAAFLASLVPIGRMRRLDPNIVLRQE
jgi:putative ABC transport system permease protein